MEKIHAMTAAELLSAERGDRPPRTGAMDLIAALTLRDWEAAARLMDANPGLIAANSGNSGALHLMAKRNDIEAVKWLLARGADPNARWGHWDADVTPLHLAAAQGHADVARLLLAAGADPRIRDSKHDSAAIGWAEFFRQPHVARMLSEHAEKM